MGRPPSTRKDLCKAISKSIPFHFTPPQYHHKVKAFLLAAGLGSRLRPLTDKMPKCLLPIHGKPILQIWLEQLTESGVDEILINTHYLHDQVEDFAKTWSGKSRLILNHEPSLLGSAGTIRANLDFLKGEDVFLVCYADNLTKFDATLLSKLLKSRVSENPLGVMALHHSNEPHRCGIVQMDENGWIRKFEEKPKNPTSNLANSGIYSFTLEALKLLPKKTPSDIGFDFIPQLVPRLLGLKMNEPLLDIGTVDAYRKANAVFLTKL